MLTYEDRDAIVDMAWDALLYLELHGTTWQGAEMACETLGRIIHKLYPDGLLTTEQVEEYRKYSESPAR